MKKPIIFSTLILLCACGSETDTIPTEMAKPMPMKFEAFYPGETRATEDSFEDGDRIGLFVADEALPLDIGGNLVNNQSLTLSNGNWTARQTMYWNDGTYNAYAYYPYTDKVSSTEGQPFSISTDQSSAKTGTTPGGYEASDLLFASTKGIKASAKPIPLQFRHIMSKLRIRLIKGEDYEGDIPETAQVFVHNTITSATVDLAEGIATRDPKAAGKSIKARNDGNGYYSAIIVPQKIENRLPLVEVVTQGMSYIFESRFTFKPGMEHRVNIIISNNPEKTRIEIGGEVDNWQ